MVDNTSAAVTIKGKSVKKGVTGVQQLKWLALGYNVPINPSKNRVYVWRKLKEYGAGYFKQGVAILPKSAQNLTRFRNLAGKILEMGGEASIVELKFLDPRDEQDTIARFCTQSENEYTELLRDCAHLLDNMRDSLFPSNEGSEYLRKMIKRYGQVQSRDYFKTGDRQAEIAETLGELAKDVSHTTEDLARQLRNMLK